MEDALLVVIITIAILIVVFLIFREINCWYWKINERISLQKEQNQLLRQILNKPSNAYIKNVDSTEKTETFEESKTEFESKNSDQNELTNNENEKVEIKDLNKDNSLDEKINKKEEEQIKRPENKPKREIKILQNEVKTTPSENKKITELGQDILSDEIIVMNLESRNIRIMKRHLYVSSEYWGIVVEG